MLLQVFALMHHSLLYQVNSSKRLLSLDSDPWSHGHQAGFEFTILDFPKTIKQQQQQQQQGTHWKTFDLMVFMDRSCSVHREKGRGASEAARRDLKADTVWSPKIFGMSAEDHGGHSRTVGPPKRIEKDYMETTCCFFLVGFDQVKYLVLFTVLSSGPIEHEIAGKSHVEPGLTEILA